MDEVPRTPIIGSLPERRVDRNARQAHTAGRSIARATRMSTAEPGQSKNEFVDIWNEILMPKFVRWKHIVVDGLTHQSAQVFPKLAVKDGDRVVDVGCGFGGTTIELARRVGPRGSAVGLDCCNAFLEHGRKEAKAAGMRNVEFIEADVQSYSFTPEFDFCFSRFGTMFFENPVSALQNMRTGLKPGGTMTMIVWRKIDDNPCLVVPKEVVLRFLPPPDSANRSGAPGPLSMADEDLVRRQLRSAGYTDIEFERIDAPLLVGRTRDEAVEFLLALGPAAEVYRQAGELAKERHDEISAALKAELAGYETPEGILMQSSSWKVTARNPD